MTISDDLFIRRAEARDLEAVGRLGARLLRDHQAFDRLRFMAPRGNTEEGYAWFLGTQLQRDDAAVFVAERAGHVVGYVYAGIEPQSWKELREEAGFIHDVYVDEDRAWGRCGGGPRRRVHPLAGRTRRAAGAVVDGRPQRGFCLRVENARKCCGIPPVRWTQSGWRSILFPERLYLRYFLRRQCRAVWQ